MVFLRDQRPTALSELLGGVDQHAEAARGLRNYGVGAQILLDLGVRDLVALSSSQPRPAALEGYGLRIVGWKTFDELESKS